MDPSDLHSIKAYFNTYYMNFVVCTKNEVRIYNAHNGKLVQVIADIVDATKKSEITSFCMDDRQRKFYIGENTGQISVFNVSNGMLIKKVKEEETSAEKKERSCEISGMIYQPIDEFKVLLTTSWDSELTIFDEEIPEESSRLRRSIGAHFEDDISSLGMSVFHSLIATGSTGGVIAVRIIG